MIPSFQKLYSICCHYKVLAQFPVLYNVNVVSWYHLSESQNHSVRVYYIWKKGFPGLLMHVLFVPSRWEMPGLWQGWSTWRWHPGDEWPIAVRFAQGFLKAGRGLLPHSYSSWEGHYEHLALGDIQSFFTGGKTGWCRGKWSPGVGSISNKLWEGTPEPPPLLSQNSPGSGARWCLPALLLLRLNPMDCSTPAFPVLHHLLEPAQPHVHQAGDAIQPSHPLSSPSPPFNFSQHQGLFQWAAQVAKVLELQLQHQSF